MDPSSKPFLIYSIVLVLLLALSGRLVFGQKYRAIFSFGDSLTDTGNAIRISQGNRFVASSVLPYGETYFGHPTGRFSDGRLIVDFIAQSMGLQLLPPSAGGKRGDGGVNFAVAGATAMDASYYRERGVINHSTNVSIATQLEWFKQLLPSLCYSHSMKFFETIPLPSSAVVQEVVEVEDEDPQGQGEPGYEATGHQFTQPEQQQQQQELQQQAPHPAGPQTPRESQNYDDLLDLEAYGWAAGAGLTGEGLLSPGEGESHQGFRRLKRARVDQSSGDGHVQAPVNSPDSPSEIAEETARIVRGAVLKVAGCQAGRIRLLEGEVSSSRGEASRLAARVAELEESSRQLADREKELVAQRDGLAAQKGELAAQNGELAAKVAQLEEELKAERSSRFENGVAEAVQDLDRFLALAFPDREMGIRLFRAVNQNPILEGVLSEVASYSFNVGQYRERAETHRRLQARIKNYDPAKFSLAAPPDEPPRMPFDL